MAPNSPSLTYSAALSTGHTLLRQVGEGVRLARGGHFEDTVALLEETQYRLRRHPLSRVSTVLPGTLANLGLAQSLCGNFDAARDHLQEARARADEHGLAVLDLIVRQNLGCLALHRGDSSAAIGLFHDLLPSMPEDRREALHVDMAEALLTEGLVEEAVEALDERAGTGPTAQLREATLRLLEGDPTHARAVGLRVRQLHGRGSLWYRFADRLVRRAGRRSPRRRGCPVPVSGTRPPHIVRAGLAQALSAGAVETALEWAELTRASTEPLVPGPASVADREHTDAYRSSHARSGAAGAEARAREWERARWRSFYAPHLRRALAAPEAPPPARGNTQPWRPVTDALRGRLGEWAYVRYVQDDDRAWALVASDVGVEAFPLGPAAVLSGRAARFAACAPGGPGYARAADEAGKALLGPVLTRVGDRPLVLSWDPFLGEPPWGALPALCGRPLSLVPSARAWMERSFRGPSLDRVLLASGPVLPGAADEVAALSRLYPQARVLSGARARPEAVLEGMERADLAHLAGHGHVPGRAAMLASVELEGAPLLACDLAGLDRVPSVVTLATCWNGRAFGRRSGPPLGFVGALLARGAHAVVASPVPVRDTETGAAMRGFHRALAAGTPVPEAVALHLGRAGFCCYGG
ncbi:CHAT domain-containing protein [Nocardiopsis xinjiangensis]|uniref:CHAT domain-containing protein n=1 Tax=Nocardiopsis xinjiangensis TaxID=124285 RepID=UPI000347314B|nr:CHAT domain-containing protein [Nocardiopsis xinjiangensis]